MLECCFLQINKAADEVKQSSSEAKDIATGQLASEPSLLVLFSQFHSNCFGLCHFYTDCWGLFTVVISRFQTEWPL